MNSWDKARAEILNEYPKATWLETLKSKWFGDHYATHVKDVSHHFTKGIEASQTFVTARINGHEKLIKWGTL